MMNSSKLFAAFLYTSLFIVSCTEDFQVTEPYKDIPVIYGIIDRADTAQYFRITKAFVDENIPATQLAKNPDSLYYPNAVVKLYNLTTKKEYILTRVDGNLEGYLRADGPFATTPNYLYKLSTKDKILNGGDSVMLELKRSEGTALVTSRISLVHDISFIFPDDNTRQLKFFYNSIFNFQWKHKDNTRVFNLKALVYIDEFDLVTQERKSKIIEIPLSNNITLGNTISSAKFSGSTFYNFFNDKLLVEHGIERYFSKIDFHLSGGGPEIGAYYNILNANTGITASQEIPRSTNISEGFGIFSSVTTIIKTITVQNPTIDSLQVHPLTRDLNFK